MRSFAVALVILASCDGRRAGPVVAAPSSLSSHPSSQGRAAGDTPSPEARAVCERPWKLEAAGGDSRVVVVCKNDVQRESLDGSSEMARALFPGLDPAQERVCACTGRLRVPPFVDLVFTAKPDEGRVTVQASAEDDLDPELGPPFIACIGLVTASFDPMPFGACPDGKASFVYPVRLELDDR